MKRFYKSVTTDSDGRVLLDGRAMKTPAKHTLIVPTTALAARIAEEWDAQTDTVRPDRMPITRLASSAIDLMPARRPNAVAETCDYARSDLICYRAERPEVLVQRQHAAWEPWLEWCTMALDAPLHATNALAPIEQPAASLDRLSAEVDAIDDWRLIGLHAATTATGSLVLGLGMLKGALDAARAFELALLDELFEVELWGLEEEQERRHQTLQRDLDGAERFLSALEA